LPNILHRRQFHQHLFYERDICTKFCRQKLHSCILGLKFLAPKFCTKITPFNVYEINPWCMVSISPAFHGQLFVQKCFEQLFSNYSLALKFLAEEYWRKSCSYNVGEIDHRYYTRVILLNTLNTFSKIFSFQSVYSLFHLEKHEN